MAEDSERPIIIKKIKKGGHGHHGGAWKVAYADFVTAMMAFFLMLWLLAAADEATLDGLAEYFTPTIGVRDSMGIGFEGGESPEVDGQKKDNLTPVGIVVGQAPQGPIPEDPKRAPIEATEDANLFEKAQEDMKRAIESDPNLRDVTDQIIVEQTPEGLKLEVMDSERYPMFEPGGTVLTEFGQRTLSKMARLIELMPNFISVTGHTDATPYNKANYGNWELSADRANAARRFLIKAGVSPERPKKVQGKAATDLLLPDQPASARNRRITIILLRGSHMKLAPGYLPATRDLLSVPRVRPSQDNSKTRGERIEKLREDERLRDQAGSLPSQRPPSYEPPEQPKAEEPEAAPEAPKQGLTQEEMDPFVDDTPAGALE